MSNFSDKEDRALVQFALKQEGARKGHMSWEQIAKQMRTKKSPEQLRCRMNSLKARHGTRIADFPRWYFVKAPRHKIRQGETSRHSKREEEQQARDLDRKAAQDLRSLFGDDEDDDDTECAALVLVVPVTSAVTSTNLKQQGEGGPDRKAAQALLALVRGDEEDDRNECAALVPFLSGLRNTASTPTKLCRRRKKVIPWPLEWVVISAAESQAAVSSIFSSISKRDVRQVSGRAEHNAGEITVGGVTKLIEACDLLSGDIFLDVGSGVGNIIAQVVLQTDVCAAIGVEIRSDLALRGKTLMYMHERIYPRLHKVQIYPDDVSALDFDKDTVLQRTTVLFCHNTVFKTKDTIVLEHICCRLPFLRTVIVQDPFCHRHRPNCIREFCTLFRERESPLYVAVSYKSAPCKLTIYDRVKV